MENKSKLYGIIGTVLFHALILLWLLFTFLSSQPPKELGGILVNFGMVDEAAGLFEPDIQPAQEVIPEEETAVVPEQQVQEEIIAQKIDQSVYVAEAKKKEEQKKKKQQEDEKKRKQAEAEKKKKEEQAKADAINRLAAGAFSSSSQQTSQGSANAGKSNQGNPFGNTNQGANKGVGGTTGGPSFSLEGRTAEGLPRPTASIAEEGRIVVNITVNSKGNVIFAEVGAGTNIGNSTMRKSAVDAAKKSKFNAIKEANNQTGTITYRYSLH